MELNSNDIEAIVTSLFNAYFYKITAFIILMFATNWIKDFIGLVITRNKLISEQIINMDNEIEVNGYRGRITKIGLTHIKIEKYGQTKTEIMFVPISMITSGAITKKTLIKESAIMESEEEKSNEDKTI